MGFVDDSKVRDALRKPFPKEQIGKLPATNKRPALDYVGHAAVSQRLNEIVPGWTYEIHERFLWENECWVEGTMTIDGISRVEYGDGKNPKDAVGNFIRRAAMRFGVALDLWSRQELLTETSGTGSTSSGGDAPVRSARFDPAEEPVSDTKPPAASPEASPVAAVGGEAAGKPSDPPAAPGDYEAPATEEQWAIAREHIGSVPTILGKYQLKFGSRKKKDEVTQLELAELIEEGLAKAR